MDEFDQARLEWEFEAVQDEYRDSCAGAVLLAGSQGPTWVPCVMKPMFEMDTWRDWDG